MKCRCGEYELKDPTDWALQFIPPPAKVHYATSCGIPAKEEEFDPKDYKPGTPLRLEE